MASKKADAADAAAGGAEVIEARVLTACVLGGMHIPAGAVVKGAAEALQAQAAIGVLDTHPDAVAYARSIDAPEVDLTLAAPAEAGSEEPKE